MSTSDVRYVRDRRDPPERVEGLAGQLVGREALVVVHEDVEAPDPALVGELPLLQDRPEGKVIVYPTAGSPTNRHSVGGTVQPALMVPIASIANAASPSGLPLTATRPKQTASR